MTHSKSHRDKQQDKTQLSPLFIPAPEHPSNGLEKKKGPHAPARKHSRLEVSVPRSTWEVNDVILAPPCSQSRGPDTVRREIPELLGLCPLGIWRCQNPGSHYCL